MYKLSIDLEKKLTVMSKKGLTAEEWMFIELLWLAEGGQPEYLQKYVNECKRDFLPREILQSLKDKGVFDRSYKLPKEGENFDPTQIEFSKSFINDYFKNSFEAGQELWDSYPSYIQGTSRQMIARNITTKGYQSQEDFFEKYNKQIRWRPENHKTVMELLEWAKEHELLQYGIAEYVITKRWEEHAQMRETGEIGKRAFKVETLEDVD